MPRFLIQLTHGEEHAACVRALGAIERFGGHFVTHADWGCKAGVHSGWLIDEFDSIEDAKRMIPPEFRQEAKIVELNSFSKEEIRDWMAQLDS